TPDGFTPMPVKKSKTMPVGVTWTRLSIVWALVPGLKIVVAAPKLRPLSLDSDRMDGPVKLNLKKGAPPLHGGLRGAHTEEPPTVELSSFRAIGMPSP